MEDSKSKLLGVSLLGALVGIAMSMFLATYVTHIAVMTDTVNAVNSLKLPMELNTD